MFAEMFISGLASSEIDSLYRHYEKFICSVPANNFISFLDWVNSYSDLPNILRSMIKEFTYADVKK